MRTGSLWPTHPYYKLGWTISLHRWGWHKLSSLAVEIRQKQMLQLCYLHLTKQTKKHQIHARLIIIKLYFHLRTKKWLDVSHSRLRNKMHNHKCWTVSVLHAKSSHKAVKHDDKAGRKDLWIITRNNREMSDHTNKASRDYLAIINQAEFKKCALWEGHFPEVQNGELRSQSKTGRTKTVGGLRIGWSAASGRWRTTATSAHSLPALFCAELGNNLRMNCGYLDPTP